MRLPRDRQTVVTSCDKMYNSAKQILKASWWQSPWMALWAATGCWDCPHCSSVSSLSQHSESHTTSKSDICKTGSSNAGLQSSWGKSLSKYLSHPLLSSRSCCGLCPSENQIPSWAVASMRVAGILSHLSIKVLPSRHRWKIWSFAVSTTGTLLSSLPNVPQQDTAMTHVLFWGTEGSFRGTVPVGISFLRLGPTAICCALFVDP